MTHSDDINKLNQLLLMSVIVGICLPAHIASRKCLFIVAYYLMLLLLLMVLLFSGL